MNKSLWHRSIAWVSMKDGKLIWNVCSPSLIEVGPSEPSKRSYYLDFIDSLGHLNSLFWYLVCHNPSLHPRRGRYSRTIAGSQVDPILADYKQKTESIIQSIKTKQNQ